MGSYSMWLLWLASCTLQMSEGLSKVLDQNSTLRDEASYTPLFIHASVDGYQDYE